MLSRKHYRAIAKIIKDNTIIRLGYIDYKKI